MDIYYVHLTFLQPALAMALAFTQNVAATTSIGPTHSKTGQRLQVITIDPNEVQKLL